MRIEKSSLFYTKQSVSDGIVEDIVDDSLNGKVTVISIFKHGTLA